MDSMFYDALGRRVRKQMAAADEYYVYEGAQVIFDLNAAGTVLREYAWYPGGVDQLLALRTTTPVSDTLAAILDPINGTVRGLARLRTGAKVKEYAEAPWGDAVADTGVVVRYRFAGREYDSESGLYYIGPQPVRVLGQRSGQCSGSVGIGSVVRGGLGSDRDPWRRREWCPDLGFEV
ncbi:MAG: hypothetical protein IPJ95_00230 [Gemmatimonadetes bacterium]|nr:hypothetical protein [Gemmatimonadota bacterium]